MKAALYLYYGVGTWLWMVMWFAQEFVNRRVGSQIQFSHPQECGLTTTVALSYTVFKVWVPPLFLAKPLFQYLRSNIIIVFISNKFLWSVNHIYTQTYISVHRLAILSPWSISLPLKTSFSYLSASAYSSEISGRQSEWKWMSGKCITHRA